MAQVSIDECRRILGSSADGMTDADIEAMRDNLDRVAKELFTQFTEAANTDAEGLRWMIHAHETGEYE